MAREVHVARGTPGTRSAPPRVPAPPTVELSDVQALLASDLRNLPEATFLLFRVEKRAEAARWLTWIVTQTCSGADTAKDRAVNVAFTHGGLEKLGLEERALNGFPEPYREGMDGTERRTRSLGDQGESAPEEWAWGSKQHAVHVLVLLYAADALTLKELQFEHEKRASLGGLDRVAMLPAAPFRSPFKEPFGFADGISQPPIIGIDPPSEAERSVATGEFLLGHRNETGVYPPSPTVAIDDASAANKLVSAVSESRRDFGRNGSYLVFRQLEQDVLAFWRLAEAQAKSNGSVEKWGAKMVGRWPSGAPLAVCPEQDDERETMNNTFGYRTPDDDRGLHCPAGAHIRRTNPRDALPRTDAYRSLAVVRQHRILRRSRAYGPPLKGWPSPQDMLQQADQTHGRGLFFMCLNADLGQQFEFIQERWIGDPTFVSAKSGELDPIAGNQGPGATFTVPADPVPVCLGDDGTPLSRFTTVRAGAYFFLPSMRALGYLARIAARS